MTLKLENFCWEEIESIEEVEEDDCYDLCVLEKDVYLDEPNYLANDMIVHNSGMHERYIERKRGREEFEIHSLLKPILGKTYGIMCVHQNAFVSMSDGTEKRIKEIVSGDLIHSYNENLKKIEVDKCVWCGPTKKENGIEIKLDNGFSTIVSKDHKFLTYYGWKEAGNLSKDDILAVPSILPVKHSQKDIANWLGSDEDVAYF